MWDRRLKLSRNKVIVGEPAVGELMFLTRYLNLEVYKIIQFFNSNDFDLIIILLYKFNV